MSWPHRNSRKGCMERVQMLAYDLGRDWRPHNGKWQPGAGLRSVTRRKIPALREALDALEKTL